MTILAPALNLRNIIRVVELATATVAPVAVHKVLRSGLRDNWVVVDWLIRHDSLLLRCVEVSWLITASTLFLVYVQKPKVLYMNKTICQGEVSPHYLSTLSSPYLSNASTAGSVPYAKR